MNISVSAFIELLRKKGFSLKVDGPDILISGHLPSLSPEEKKALRDHKPEIIEHLKHEQIALMSLEDFGKSNMAVKIFSEVLDREVYFCSNEKMRDSIRHTGLTAYLPGELSHLVKVGSDSESLKQIDEAKEIFPGSEVIN